jgi:radical SAM protein with 4Fe4S-binding SPASM domain
VISLDAYDSKGYKAMRGGSKKVFDKVLENINMLVEKRDRFNKKLKIRLGYVCTKENYRGIPSMVQLAEDLNVDQLFCDNLVPYGIPGFLEDQCLYEDDLDVIETIECIESPNRNLEVWMPALISRQITKRQCREPFMILKIDGNGNIGPCSRFLTRKESGNIFMERKVWNNKEFQRMRTTMIDESLQLPKLCQTCDRMRPSRIILNKASK